jgi:hypothetical protein
MDFGSDYIKMWTVVFTKVMNHPFHSKDPICSHIKDVVPKVTLQNKIVHMWVVERCFIVLIITLHCIAFHGSIVRMTVGCGICGIWNSYTRETKNSEYTQGYLKIYNLFITSVTTQQIIRSDHLWHCCKFRLLIAIIRQTTWLTHIYTPQNCRTNKIGYNIIKIYKNTWRKKYNKLNYIKKKYDIK